MMLLGPVTRLLVVPAISRLLLLLALVVAVFLAESFTNLLEEALRNDGGSLDVVWLLMLKTPEIIDLALAIGVLIAVYFSVLDARNRGELVILATSGVRWIRVLGFALCLGIAGGALSIVVAGYIVPKARYAERIALAQLKAEYVTDKITVPGPRNARQTIQNTTFIATPPKSTEQERGQLFVFQPGEQGSWRVGQSQDWSVQGPDETGQHEVVLKNLQAYNGTFSMVSPRPINKFRVESAGLKFRMSDVVSNPNFKQKANERLLSYASMNSRELGSVGARALLVPAAALLALVAVLFSTSGFIRYLALPAASIVLLFLDLVGRTLIAEAIPTMGAPFLASISILAYLSLPMAIILWRGEALMKPARRG